MPRLEITLEGPLLVGGGHAAGLGVDATTSLRFHQGRWVPYVPGSALRGAVRQHFEALLRGAGEEVSSPFPWDGAGGAPGDTVALLFGHSGPDGSRTASREGQLRFGDALPVDPEEAAGRLAIRPHVALDDHRGTAEDRKLFFREVAEASTTPLVFEADLDLHPDLTDEHRRWLRAAVETTPALGAAKASGGGALRIRWNDEPRPSVAKVTGDPATATRARLILRLLEPAHFGDGGPLGNYHGTRTFVPGATVRGAIAWALLRAGRTTPDSEGFRALFLDEGSPVGFGDALARPADAGDPDVRPITRRRTRGAGGGGTVDLLATELARDRVNRELDRQGSGTYLQAAAAGVKLDRVEPRPAPGLLRRVRTRVSIDRHRATAADSRLFSIEQIEAWTLDDPARGHSEDPGSASRPVELVATVEGLTPAASALLARVEGLPLLVGGRRNHGLGKVELEVELLPAEEAPVDEARRRITALSRQVASEVRHLADLAGLSPAPESPDTLILALVARTDFVPDADDDHPLRRWPAAGEPVRRLLEAGSVGGYDQRGGHDGRQAREPLKTLRPSVGAGSVYVYEVPEAALQNLLQASLSALARGVGGSRELGCGRFEVFRPLAPSSSSTSQEEPK